MAASKPADKQVPVTEASDSGSSHLSNSSPPHHGSYQDHPFSDPAAAQHWRQIYENAEYEGRHRFDPKYTWEAEEEKRLVKRVSRRSQGAD
jgi:hypothetical protein